MGVESGDDEIDLTERRPYQPPQVEAFNDLQDILLLDPIHDVDEAGWPMAAPPTDVPRLPYGVIRARVRRRHSTGLRHGAETGDPRSGLCPGIPIRLRATDADVLTEFSIALNHHTRTHPAVGDGATQINIWSASATGVTRPTMPADLRDRVIARRADLAPGADHHFDFDPAARMLTVMDPSTGRVDVCVNNLAELPQWETAAPCEVHWDGSCGVTTGTSCTRPPGRDDNGNAALLLGAGGAGKSTTSLRCRQAGMGFLGDDICAVSHWLNRTCSTCMARPRPSGRTTVGFRI